jgi:hypothetical protein
MTLILSTLDKGCGATNERVTSRDGSNAISLATLATSCVVCNLAHVLVNGKRFSGNSRLIASDDGVALSDWVLLVLIAGAVALLVIWIAFDVELVLISELEVSLIFFRGFVVANQLAISWDGCSFLNNDLGM